MPRTIPLIVAMLVWMPGAASAQWTVRPFAGVNLGSQHGFVDLDDTAGRVQPTFGVAAGRDLSNAWSVEFEFATSPKFLKGDSGLVDSGRVDTFFANANRRFGGPASRFQPYLTAGIGTARVTLADALHAFTATSSLIAANIGGGTVVATGKTLRLIGDVRYIRSQYGDAGPAGLGEEYVSFWRVSGGALLRF
jgi:outer membrane protein with beta-barrel domain